MSEKFTVIFTSMWKNYFFIVIQNLSDQCCLLFRVNYLNENTDLKIHKSRTLSCFNKTYSIFISYNTFVKYLTSTHEFYLRETQRKHIKMKITTQCEIKHKHTLLLIFPLNYTLIILSKVLRILEKDYKPKTHRIH